MKRIFRGKFTSYLFLFALEGLMLQFVMAMNNYGNYLFADNLGATDSQIGLVPSMPNLAACLLLIPTGLITSRMKSARSMLALLLGVSGIAYFAYLLIPGAGQFQILLYFFLLALTNGSIAVYNSQWQAFFGEAVDERERNHVFTYRNRIMLIAAIVVPLLCGVIMSEASTTQSKLNVLLVFYVLCGAFLLFQLFILYRIPLLGNTDSQKIQQDPRRESIGTMIRESFRDRRYLLFMIPFGVYWALWQLDWSMWYLGQVQYIHMNETELALYNGIFNVVQFLAIGPLAIMVRKKGPDFASIVGAMGLMTCPLLIAVCSTFASHAASFWVFTLSVSLLNSTQCVLGLCTMHIQLDIIPLQRRAFLLSVYATLNTLTNSFMPWLGVQLYTALGADHNAFIQFNIISFAFRTISMVMLLVRYRYLGKHNMLTHVS